MLSAFLALQIPLVALVLYLVFASSMQWSATLPMLVIVLAATLLGIGATLYVLHALLRPVALVSEALGEYADSGRMPSLPTNFTDQAGRLMADVQYVIEQLDNTICTLEENVAMDYLTGVYNRRAGEERLASDLARVGRGEGGLNVVVVDLDRFKPINDQYGHQAGDECLRHVANIYRRNIRKGDWLARWGGDEFVLGLWEAKSECNVNQVLQRIATELDEHPAQLPQGHRIRLTFSAGIVRCNSSEDADRGIDEVFALADEALYKAKEDEDRCTFFIYAG